MLRWLRSFIHHVSWRKRLCPMCQCYGAVGNWCPCHTCRNGSDFLSNLRVYPGCLNPWTLEKYGLEAVRELVEHPEGWQKLPPRYIRFADGHHAYIAIDPDTGEVDTTNWNDPTIQRMVKDGVITN